MPKGERQYKGSRTGPSAADWNSFLQMRKDYYQTTIGNHYVPELLTKSTIVNVVLEEDQDPIVGYAPCRIVESVGTQNDDEKETTYIVTPIQETEETGYHGHYGFTLAEGVTAQHGGRIVIAGAAIVALDPQTVRDAWGEFDYYYYFDNLWYNIHDDTISSESLILGPTGHFRCIGHTPIPTPEQVQFGGDYVFIAIDMNTRPGKIFIETIEDPIPAKNNAILGLGTAVVGVPSTSRDQLEWPQVTDPPTQFKVHVFNPFEYEIPAETRTTATFSVELNGFVIDSTPQPAICEDLTQDPDFPVLKNSSHAGSADSNIQSGQSGSVTVPAYGQISGLNVGGTDIEAGDAVTLHVLDDCQVQFQRTLDTDTSYSPDPCFYTAGGIPVYPNSSFLGNTYAGGVHAVGENGTVSVVTWWGETLDVDAKNVGDSDAPSYQEVIVHLLDDCTWAFQHTEEYVPEEPVDCADGVYDFEMHPHTQWDAKAYGTIDPDSDDGIVKLQGTGTFDEITVFNYGNTTIEDGEDVILHVTDNCKFVVQRPDYSDTTDKIIGYLFTKTSGVAGDDTTVCTFKYTVSLFDGTVIGTGIDPAAAPHIFNRHGVGQCIPAEAGYGYNDGTQYIICDCTEKLATEACT